MRVSEHKENNKLKQLANNPFKNFEEIELAIETIHLKLMNCLNASNDTFNNV